MAKNNNPICGEPPADPPPAKEEWDKTMPLNPDLLRSTASRSGNWNKGDIIIDDFVVVDTLGEGGMGKVYKVRSRSTGMCFAVKYAKDLSETAQRNFLAELQTWIGLPEHPNLVACRFFRTMGNDILIFAEFVPGNSLEDWIESRKLYAMYSKDPKKALERMLDIVIQFAWGQHCLHMLGLVHQDVKPANVLMTLDIKKGSVRAQITDFGLARYRASRGEFNSNVAAQKNLMLSCGGMTPLYCSPEQEKIQKLTFKTDIWSWAVSVLEMFSGGGFWNSGAEAGAALEEFVKSGACREGIPRMPQELVGILRECLTVDTERRLDSLGKAGEKLKEIYRREIGVEYVRDLPEPVLKSEHRNRVNDRKSKAGGTWKDPRIWLEQALKAEGRELAEADRIIPQHGDSRRGQLVAELAGFDAAKHIFERLVNGGRKDLEQELATLCMEKALVHLASDDSTGALAESDQAIGICERLVNIENHRESADALAEAYSGKATILYAIWNFTDALVFYDQAIDMMEKMINIAGRSELSSKLAKAYTDKANVLNRLGNYVDAMQFYNRAIGIRERLVNKEGRRDLAGELAMVYMNKATSYYAQGDIPAALALYDQVIEIREQLIYKEGRHEMVNELAKVYMNKANALYGLGNNTGAIQFYDRAIGIRERLVNEEGRREVSEDLAMTYMNKANALHALGNNIVAIDHLDQAIGICERLVNIEGRRELAGRLAMAYATKAEITAKAGDNISAVALYDRVIEIRERLVNKEGKSELAGDLAKGRASRGILLIAMGDSDAGLQQVRDAMAVLREEIERTGRSDLKSVLELASNGIGD